MIPACHTIIFLIKLPHLPGQKNFQKVVNVIFFYFIISLGGECGFSFEQISPKDVRCQFWVKMHGPLVMQKMKLSRKNKITKSSMSSTISAIKILHFGETSNRPLVIFIQSLDGNILIKSIISLLKIKVESNMKKIELIIFDVNIHILWNLLNFFHE